MSFKKNSKARQTARSHALFDGPIQRQHAPGVSGGSSHAIIGVLRQSQGAAHGLAAAHARAGADARPIRVPAPARAVATRRLAGRQRALLSGVYRGRPGAPTETAVATRDRRASRTAKAGGRRPLSPEAIARIRAGQKRRWAKVKGTAAPAAAAKAPVKKKGGLTAAGRAKLAAAMKKRWAAAKKSGGPAPTAKKK